MLKSGNAKITRVGVQIYNKRGSEFYKYKNDVGAGGFKIVRLATHPKKGLCVVKIIYLNEVERALLGRIRRIGGIPDEKEVDKKIAEYITKMVREANALYELSKRYPRSIEKIYDFGVIM